MLIAYPRKRLLCDIAIYCNIRYEKKVITNSLLKYGEMYTLVIVIFYEFLES